MENYPRMDMLSGKRNKSQTSFSNFSIGKLYKNRYTDRKSKIENSRILKYVKSKAPEVIINPSNEFSMVRPLNIKSSTYVKNYKRKLKKSYLKSATHSTYE